MKKDRGFSAVSGKLQTFAGAMMVPIILLVLVGLFVGIGSAFTNFILEEGTVFYKLFSLISSIGFMIMGNLPLWFAIGIAFGLAKTEKGWAAFSGFVFYMAFNTIIGTFAGLQGWSPETVDVAYLVNELGYAQDAALNFNSLWTNVAGIWTYNMGIFSSIITGIITAFIHNKYYKKQMPNAFSFFGGTRYVVMVLTFLAIPLGVLAYYMWPVIATGLQHFTNLITKSGLFGTFLFGAADKALLPFGIHHLIAFPIEYTSVGGTMEIDGILYEGVRNIIVGQSGSADALGYITRNFTTGRLLFQLGGLPGAAAAIWSCARPENKKKVASIVIPAALTVMLVGVSEPIEYTFLFVNPLLYYCIHVPLSGLAYVLTELTNVSINGHAIFFMLPNLFQPHKVHAMSVLLLIPLYFALYFFLFRWAIKKWNIPTPGRRDDGRVNLYSKKEYRKMKGETSADTGKETENTLAMTITDGLGGKDNIVSVTNCATRLRVTVKDPELVAPNDFWSGETGASGVLRNKEHFQIVYGPQVNNIAAGVKEYLDIG